jgi:hypothetical protein
VSRPLIQVDDEVREMNDEELEWYEALIANSPAVPSAE